MSALRSRHTSAAAVLALLIGASLASGCASKEQPRPAITNGAAATAPGSTIKPTATTARGGGGTTVPTRPGEITIKDYAFTPSPLAVKVGTSATWTNLESDPPVEHWVKSDPGATFSFDSGKLGLDATYSVTFNNPGEYSYYCAIHDFMKGKIVVSA